MPIGLDVTAAKTAAEAMTLAKLDWKVSTAPMFASVTVDGQTIPTQVEVPLKAIVRADRPTVVLGTVGKKYNPLQNDELFAVADELRSLGNVEFVRAGALEGGARLWMQVKLPNPITVGKNDVVDRYLTLVNSHDGSCALKAMVTPLRL